MSAWSKQSRKKVPPQKEESSDDDALPAELLAASDDENSLSGSEKAGSSEVRSAESAISSEDDPTKGAGDDLGFLPTSQEVLTYVTWIVPTTTAPSVFKYTSVAGEMSKFNLIFIAPPLSRSHISCSDTTKS